MVHGQLVASVWRRYEVFPDNKAMNSPTLHLAIHAALSKTTQGGSIAKLLFTGLRVSPARRCNCRVVGELCWEDKPKSFAKSAEPRGDGSFPIPLRALSAWPAACWLIDACSLHAFEGTVGACLHQALRRPGKTKPKSFAKSAEPRGDGSFPIPLRALSAWPAACWSIDACDCMLLRAPWTMGAGLHHTLRGPGKTNPNHSLSLLSLAVTVTSRFVPNTYLFLLSRD